MGLEAGKVPYVDSPQLNSIRHAQVPGKIYLYIRRYRPKRTIYFFHILPVLQYFPGTFPGTIAPEPCVEPPMGPDASDQGHGGVVGVEGGAAGGASRPP